MVAEFVPRADAGRIREADNPSVKAELVTDTAGPVDPEDRPVVTATGAGRSRER